MIVMELGNADLSSWMRSLSRKPNQLPFPAFVADPDLVRSLFRQMAHAISLLHSRGIVHNDLKPSNFLFTDGCRLKLIDFGVSRQLEVDKTSQVELDKLCGTLDYMSPERLSDRRTSPAGDVWALGCILHELAFGIAPFGHLKTAISKISAIAGWPHNPNIPFPPKNLLHESCAKVLDDDVLISLIKICMCKAPKQRPTAGDLLHHPFLTGSPKRSHISLNEAFAVLREAAAKHQNGDDRRHFVSQALDYIIGSSQSPPI